MIWHSTKLEEVIKHLGTDPINGLTTEVAEQKLERYGENRLTGKKKPSFLARFAAQLKDFMVVVLMVAAAISLITALIYEPGEPSALLEPIIIVAIVIVNALLGVFQESRAEAALEALKNMESPSARVIRNGKRAVISAALLVPGDLIELEAGDYIPADARLVEVASLHCNESSLTGESLPVEKLLTDELNDIDAIGDRLNMVYSGCSVTYGHALAVVTETGMYTEIGKVARLLSGNDNNETPLKIKLARLGKSLGFVVMGICCVIFLIGLVQALLAGHGLGARLLESFMTAVSLAVAAIPESLATIVTIVLALGVQRMVKKGAIIRRLPAVETLGSASVICSDKTGTLTQNKMTLVSMFDGSTVTNLKGSVLTESEVMLLKLSAMCCNASAEIADGRQEGVGDPTELAISAAALNHLGLSKYDIDNMYPRMCELPFDSERKLMTSVNIIEGQPIAIVKGAPDVLLERCTCDAEAILKINDQMASEALRVLAVAVKPLSEIPTNPCSEELEYGLNFVGLLGMIDPPRQDAIEAVAACKQAGIRTIMITGDHILTATAIAKQLGIIYGDLKAITGAELMALSDEELFENITDYAVYARVTPEDKLRIVKAWQRRGDIVAMTGDGVNDAPALQAADIGCAMGRAGTDVAKGAADMILTDDNFTTIATAVREGRGIYDNIRKAVHFLLSCNLGEIIAVFLGSLFWGGSPFSAIQLLWINLVTDSAPALALGTEPAEKDIMERSPRHKNESIFAGGLGINALWNGAMIGALSLIAYAIGLASSGDAACAKTMAFAVMAFSQIIHAFNTRSSHSVISAGLLANKPLLAATALSVLLVLAVMLIPSIASVFGLVPLASGAWVGIFLLSLVPLAVVEIYKAVLRIKKELARNN